MPLDRQWKSASSCVRGTVKTVWEALVSCAACVIGFISCAIVLEFDALICSTMRTVESLWVFKRVYKMLRSQTNRLQRRPARTP